MPGVAASRANVLEGLPVMPGVCLIQETSTRKSNLRIPRGSSASGHFFFWNGLVSVRRTFGSRRFRGTGRRWFYVECFFWRVYSFSYVHGFPNGLLHGYEF